MKNRRPYLSTFVIRQSPQPRNTLFHGTFRRYKKYALNRKRFFPLLLFSMNKVFLQHLTCRTPLTPISEAVLNIIRWPPPSSFQVHDEFCQCLFRQYAEHSGHSFVRKGRTLPQKYPASSLLLLLFCARVLHALLLA